MRGHEVNRTQKWSRGPVLFRFGLTTLIMVFGFSKFSGLIETLSNDLDYIFLGVSLIVPGILALGVEVRAPRHNRACISLASLLLVLTGFPAIIVREFNPASSFIVISDFTTLAIVIFVLAIDFFAMKRFDYPLKTTFWGSTLLAFLLVISAFLPRFFSSLLTNLFWFQIGVLILLAGLMVGEIIVPNTQRDPIDSLVVYNSAWGSSKQFKSLTILAMYGILFLGFIVLAYYLATDPNVIIKALLQNDVISYVPRYLVDSIVFYGFVGGILCGHCIAWWVSRRVRGVSNNGVRYSWIIAPILCLGGLLGIAHFLSGVIPLLWFAVALLLFILGGLPVYLLAWVNGYLSSVLFFHHDDGD